MKYLTRSVYLIYSSITLFFVVTMDIQETTLKTLMKLLILFVVISFMNIFLELTRQTDKEPAA